MGKCGGTPAQHPREEHTAPPQGSAGSCHPCSLLGLWPGLCHIQPSSVECLHSCAAMLGGPRGHEVRVCCIWEEATSLCSHSVGISAVCARLPFKSQALKYPRQPGAVPGEIWGLQGIRASCSWQPHGTGCATSGWHSTVPSSHGPSVWGEECSMCPLGDTGHRAATGVWVLVALCCGDMSLQHCLQVLALGLGPGIGLNTGTADGH